MPSRYDRLPSTRDQRLHYFDITDIELKFSTLLMYQPLFVLSDLTENPLENCKRYVPSAPEFLTLDPDNSKAETARTFDMVYAQLLTLEQEKWNKIYFSERPGVWLPTLASGIEPNLYWSQLCNEQIVESNGYERKFVRRNDVGDSLGLLNIEKTQILRVIPGVRLDKVYTPCSIIICASEPDRLYYYFCWINEHKARYWTFIGLTNRNDELGIRLLYRKMLRWREIDPKSFEAFCALL